MENRPAIIGHIEEILGGALRPAEERPTVWDDLLACKKGEPKYALGEDGHLTGLNLYATGLDTAKWEKIAALLAGGARHLRALVLAENGLTALPLPPGMAALRHLDAGANQLTEFALAPGMEGLAELWLEENEGMVSPPPEKMKEGPAAVLRFLKDGLAQGYRELWEVKMLIVGEGDTGKTTLWNLLQDPGHPVPGPKKYDPTLGIQIKEGHPIDHASLPGVKIKVNLWDFGGQEIQYMTHQFFLTRRSFYVLLSDGRRESDNFAYWLQIIQLLGCEEKREGRMPVLVVLNTKGVANPKMPYATETVEEDYPGLQLIKEELDFAKKGRKLEALAEEIQRIVSTEIRHLPLKIPTFYDQARQELVRLRGAGTKHISNSRFVEICTAAGLAQQQQRADLSQLLHSLGVILHYRENTHLKNFVVLDPLWVVKAVYEILDHKAVKETNQGRFDHALLQEIWTEKGYSTDEQDHLLSLMLKDQFEVCLKATEKGKEIFIAPQLLPNTRPGYFQWEDSPDTLRFIYHYPFMPKGIIGRLIVRLHERIESRDGQKMVWQRGTVVEMDGCRGLVQHVEEKETGRQLIKIEVQQRVAEDRRKVLYDIRQKLDGIHDSSFPALKVNKIIPCNCPVCEKTTNPAEHGFDKIENFKRQDVTTSQCGRTGQPVPIQQLLEGVFTEQEIRMEGMGKPDFAVRPIEEKPWHKRFWGRVVWIGGGVTALCGAIGGICEATGSTIFDFFKWLGF